MTYLTSKLNQLARFHKNLGKLNRKNMGFTLLEILAALAIAAVGLAALAKTISGSVHLTDAATTRTLAYWVASNHASEIHITQKVPKQSIEKFSMANHSWSLKRLVQQTKDEDLYKIVIKVSEQGSQKVLAQLTTYLARLDPPKKSI